MNQVGNQVNIKPIDLPNEVLAHPPQQHALNQVERIEYPEEGGIKRYFKGHKYPKKGLPMPIVVARMDAVKKMLMVTVKFLSSTPARYFLMLALALPSPLFKKLLQAIKKYYFVDFFEVHLRDYLLKPERYCPAAREIRRILLKVTEDEAIAETFAMIIEFDPPYRMRLQDLANDFDGEAFIKSPAKEIQKCIEVLAEREVETDPKTYEEIKVMVMNEKYKQIGKLLRIMFFLKPSIKRFFIELVDNSYLEDLKTDEEDEYWAMPYLNYNFGGLSLRQRSDKFLSVYREFNKDGKTTS